MWFYQSPDELYHYGVLGMKWGVRRGRYDNAVSKARKKAGSLEKSVAKASNKKYKYANPLIRTSMSDGRYKQWTRKEDKAIAKAMNWYKKVEKGLGKDAVASIANSGPGYSVGAEYCHKRFGNKV